MNGVTKEELRERLLSGERLEDVIPVRLGQDCDIVKAAEFEPGARVIYIPDLDLNGIPARETVSDPGRVEEIVECCYTGDDFLELCDGDAERAKELFRYCDWQHPSSALPEMDDGMEG